MAQAQVGRTAQKSAEVFELKSASLSLLSLVLRSSDLALLEAALKERLGDTPDVFNHDPLLIDLSHLTRAPLAPESEGQAQLSLDDQVAAADVELAPLVALLRQFRMQPVAVVGASAAELAQAMALGLAEAPASDAPAQPRKEMAASEAAAGAKEVVVEVVREVIKEVRVEVPVPLEGSARTLIIDKPLRSGQQVYAKGGDLVVLALVNHGAEVIADGSIHVYAPLRGKAIAGAKGNTEARIFATCMEAELIAIAGTYRTTENPLPETVLGKPAQIRLEGEKLVMEALNF
ncbi:septum site-determining protein MinC [Paucibacter sp. Y2R2-4]|uniref:septum site-determining protein MinC n=1 Tax=Paucibacter sp. Y2R2-4 TaxID=2893553 RepID=UPI0021E39592|nr:septum site-determining protein MinC [Paucibacter sp. Y2R2-4]MCV2351886.1 septum site-determining protein MinC [Paucibacter sp. Y2R2-4]